MSNNTSLLAFYYPGAVISPYWAKKALLFFDGIALLTPRLNAPPEQYFTRLPQQLHESESVAKQVALGIEMMDRGLVRIISPDDLMDKNKLELFAMEITNLISSGTFDDLKYINFSKEAWIHRSKFGFEVDSGLAKMIVEEL